MSLLNEIAHLYIGVEQMDLDDDRWVLLIDEMMALKSIGNAAHQRLQPRGDLNKFEYVPDDPETEDIDESKWYSEIYIFEAKFPSNSIDLGKWKTKLANLFGVNLALITHSIGTITFSLRKTVFVTFKYDGIDEIRVGLFGCESDNILCTRKESMVECSKYMSNNNLVFNPAVD